jgi:hypothetical protein
MNGSGRLGKPWRILVRFGLWWAGLFGLIGTGNCPCCGQPGCPGGAVSTGLLAALAAGLLALFPRAGKKSRAAESPQGDADAEQAGSP